MNIYVGNLPRQTGESELRQVFEKYGEVSRVSIITDKFSGEPRGFGFVEMPNKDHAQAAITELHGSDLSGRTLNVSEARPKPEGDRGGNRRSGGGGGYNRSW